MKDRLVNMIKYVDYIKNRLQTGMNPNRKGVSPEAYKEFWQRELKKAEKTLEDIRLSAPAKR